MADPAFLKFNLGLRRGVPSSPLPLLTAPLGVREAGPLIGDSLPTMKLNVGVPNSPRGDKNEPRCVDDPRYNGVSGDAIASSWGVLGAVRCVCAPRKGSSFCVSLGSLLLGHRNFGLDGSVFDRDGILPCAPSMSGDMCPSVCPHRPLDGRLRLAPKLIGVVDGLPERPPKVSRVSLRPTDGIRCIPGEEERTEVEWRLAAEETWGSALL